MYENQRVDMEKSKQLLKRQVLSHMPGAGDYETALPGVHMFRRDETTQPQTCFYRPVIVKMIQGYKRALMGKEVYRYGEDDLLVTGVDMPGASMTCEATPESPSLSIVIDLDRNLIAQLSLEIPYAPVDTAAAIKGVHVQPLDAEMLDAYVRLAELFDQPHKLAVLGPMIVREIHYLLLVGPNGHRLRALHTRGSQSNQVAQAIAWLKHNLSTSIPVEELAEKVHMAPSTFHRHFKEVTNLSPVQFQKRLRLHEAQRLMLVQDMDASHACLAVGYESLSQFTREYKRLFGDPPRKDIKRLREYPTFSRPPARVEKAVELQDF